MLLNAFCRTPNYYFQANSNPYSHFFIKLNHFNAKLSQNYVAVRLVLWKLPKKYSMAKFNFNLRNPNSKRISPIQLIIRWDCKKLNYGAKEFIAPGPLRPRQNADQDQHVCCAEFQPGRISGNSRKQVDKASHPFPIPLI